MRVGKLTQLALLCALTVIGKELMHFLPNIHPVALLLILTTLVYGSAAFAVAVCFTLLEAMLYGFGLWTVQYLLAFPLLVAAVLPFRKSGSRLFFALLAAAHGLTFGAVCALVWLFAAGGRAALAYWVSGIPFDLIHGVSNGLLVWFLLPPLRSFFTKFAPVSGENPSNCR